MKLAISAFCTLAVLVSQASAQTAADANRFSTLDASIRSQQRLLVAQDQAAMKLSAMTSLRAGAFSASLAAQVNLLAGPICPQLKKNVAEINGLVRKLAPKCLDLKKTLEVAQASVESQEFLLAIAQKEYDESLKLISSESQAALKASKSAVNFVEAEAALAESRALKAVADTSFQVEAGLYATARANLELHLKICMTSDTKVAVNESDVQNRLAFCLKQSLIVAAQAEVELHASLSKKASEDSAKYQALISKYEAQLKQSQAEVDAYVNAEIKKLTEAANAKKLSRDAVKTVYDVKMAELKAAKELIAANSKIWSQCPNYFPRTVNYVCDQLGQ